MKLILVFVIIFVGIIEINANEQPAQEETNKEESSAKTKRGIFNYGYGSGVHALTYDIPLGTAAYPYYGFQKPWHTSHYAKYPTVYSNFISPPVHHHDHHHHPVVTAGPQPIPQYIISPGNAHVTSYSVNYPKYPVYNKPHIDIPFNVPVVKPSPSIILQKPIIPVAIPTFSNRIPVARPTYHVISAASAPVYPVQPQFIPIPLPAHTPTISSFPTTVNAVPTYTTTTTPAPHFITNVQTDAWRPIIVTHQHPTPTTPTITIHRPAINLQPPYGSAPTGVGASGDQPTHQQQLELQPFDSTEYTNQQHQYQPQLNQLYLSPSSDNSLENNNEGGHQFGQEFVQGNHQHHQHLHQQYQQIQQHQQHQAQLIQEQQQIHSRGAFNGQGYEPPSNNGLYSGPSSYEVQLGSYTRTI